MASEPVEYQLHWGDLPDSFRPAGTVAIDTEAMGLRSMRDRLCMAQFSNGDGRPVQLVAFPPKAEPPYHTPNIVRILEDRSITKLFHFGRFDIGILKIWTGSLARPVYCTKIASKLVRTYSQHHGLGVLVREGIGQEILKGEQSSDWGSGDYSPTQLEYAARDVLYLHRLQIWLDEMLDREGRESFARAAFDYLPEVVKLDLNEYTVETLFSHI